MIFFILFISFYPFPSSAEPIDLTSTLFQNKFFSLSTDESLLCATSNEGFLPYSELMNIIDFYEKINSPKLRKNSVQVLTDHENSEHLKDLQGFKGQCDGASSVPLCILEKYWGSKEAALRVLALFYDTKTIMKHGEDYSARHFTLDHLRVFEKAIRKTPPFLRKLISKAKPIRELDKVIQTMDNDVKELIKEAYPADFATSIWSDGTHPLTLVPGRGFKGQVVAQVYNGQNLIIFTVRALDKAKDGLLYRDINLKYLVDFRLPIIVHEIAHTIDNFHFWDGQEELYYFFRHRKLSTDNKTVKLIQNATLALWPSKWFEAFEYLWEVNDGRYDGQVQEKLAELVAQYMLIPERLKISTPTGYAWLRDEVFNKIEYKGYDRCTLPITRQLHWWEQAIAKILGRNNYNIPIYLKEMRGHNE